MRPIRTLHRQDCRKKAELRDSRYLVARSQRERSNMMSPSNVCHEPKKGNSTGDGESQIKAGTFPRHRRSVGPLSCALPTPASIPARSLGSAPAAGVRLLRTGRAPSHSACRQPGRGRDSRPVWHLAPAAYAATSAVDLSTTGVRASCRSPFDSLSCAPSEPSPYAHESAGATDRGVQRHR